MTHAVAYFINLAGAVTLGPYDLGANTAAIISVGVNQANTILYWARTSQHGQAGYPITQFVIATLTASDFLAGTADDTSAWWPYVLVLSDDSVVVGFFTNNGTPNYRFLTSVIRRYNSSAVLQTEWDIFPEIAGPAWIFSARDNPTTFWVWSVGISTVASPSSKPWNKYFHFTVASASVPTPLLLYQFIEGTSQQAGELGAESFGTDWGSAPFIAGGSTVTTTTQTIRRERRFLLPSSPDNKNVQVPTLELLMRTGIGLTPAAWDGANVPQGANPQVMMRISKDGGKTWGPERWRSAGAIGRYLTRVRWLRATGNYRNAVMEIVVSDPVDWQLLAVLGTPVEGSS